jgi:hypothetical protein
VSRNNLGSRRQAAHSAAPMSYQKKDEFANWMCSWSIEQSLWTSEIYRKALLAYVGRIYEQRVHMYRLFTQIKENIEKFDELDLLNHLIEKTKERHGAYRTNKKKPFGVISLFSRCSSVTQ